MEKKEPKSEKKERKAKADEEDWEDFPPSRPTELSDMTNLSDQRGRLPAYLSPGHSFLSSPRRKSPVKQHLVTPDSRFSRPVKNLFNNDGSPRKRELPKKR